MILVTGLLIHYESFLLKLSYSANDEIDGNQTPIEHIIVLSQGRRSFDNYFGTYPGANGFPNNISIPTNPLENPVEFKNFTINLDVKLNHSNTKNEKFIITKGGLGKETPGDNLNFGILVTRDSKIKAGFEDRQGMDNFVYSTKRYNDNKWHNILVSYDGNTLSLYIDKILVAKKNTNNADPDDNKLPFIRIGANFLKTELFFTGDLDRLKIWNRTLTETEITSLLNGSENNYDPLIDLERDLNSTSEFINFNGSNYFDIKATSKNSQATLVKPFNLQNTKTPQLSFDKTVFEKSYNYGFMDGFINAQNTDSFNENETIVMGYYDNKTIGLYWLLASEYVLADNFFGSTSNDLANNLRLYSLDSNSYKKNIPQEGLLNINSTLFDILEKNDVSWKIYVENYDPNLNYTLDNDISKRHLPLNPILAIPRFVENSTLNSKIVDLNQYFKDLKEGLPDISYIVSSDSHETSPKDILKGEEFVTTLVAALMQSKYWKDSVFILTYSSSGGWYDHVIPPQLDGNQLGFRVPSLIISPYAKTGLVDSTLYDSTSILKFIEYNKNITLPNSSELKSNNLINSFNFDNNPKNSKKIVNDLINEYEVRNFGTVEEDEIDNIHFIFILYSLIIISIPIIFFSSLVRIKNKNES
ncbi:MAG: alkaline phosphatase family protein [Nitrososphaeraceae archaeon]